jgi:4-amino-4-deoxy-L-arabinose transferase-like glycosyltransferase
LLLVSFVFRNYYQALYGGIIYNSDTVTYYYAAQHIFEGVIDVFRPPVYPIIIKIFQCIDEENIFGNIIIYQHIISFASIVPFYFVCKQWLPHKYMGFLASLVYACLPQVIYYNNAIYPESLLISSLIFFLYLISTYLTRPGIFKAIFIPGFIFYLVMLKPICIKKNKGRDEQ